MSKHSVAFYVDKLKLIPHPEGGYYHETYRSESSFRINAENEVIRNCSTAIYFLMEKNNFSAFHKIKSDEIWHFYAGSALEVIEIDSLGNVKKTLIGSNLANGEKFQYVVPANTWFASRVANEEMFSLVGCTVSPGFDFADFELAIREYLINLYPNHRKLIESLTRI